MGTPTWIAVVVVIATGAVLSDVTDAQGEHGFPEYFTTDIGANPVDIVFVVDTSDFNNETDSMEGEIMVKGFIAGFLDNADIDSGAVKAAFVTYNTHPKVVFDLDDYSSKSEMVDAVYLSEFEEGERNTADALGRVRSQILRQDRADVPNVVVLIMTGASDRNSHRTLQEADALKYARSTIFVMGVDLDEAGINEMNQLSSKPTIEHSFTVSSFSEFEILRDVLFAQIFTWAEQAYNVPAAGSESLDVAFLLHFSNSMDSTAHAQILDFMKSILQYSHLDDDKVHVGAAVFRKKGNVLFDFNAHDNQQDLFETIDKISYNLRSKQASIASGFDTVRTSLFTNSTGDRPEVPNLIILITDANSNTDVGDTIPAVEKVKASGTAVFVIGVNVSYVEEMTTIASSSDFTILVNDTKYLKDQAMTLYDSFVALRTDGFPVVIPAEQTTSPTPPFYEPTTIATTETFLPAIPISDSEAADLIIAIHLSPRVSQGEFVTFQEFLKMIVSTTDVESGKVQLGMIFYGADPELLFHIDKYTSVDLIQKEIDGLSLKSRSDKVDSSAALGLVRQILTPIHGRRDDIPAAVVFFTDQASNINNEFLMEEKRRLTEDEIEIFAVGLGMKDKSELINLASKQSNVMNYDSIRMLNDAEADLRGKIRAFRTRSRGPVTSVTTTTVATRRPRRTTPDRTTMLPTPAPRPVTTDEPKIKIPLPHIKTVFNGDSGSSAFLLGRSGSSAFAPRCSMGHMDLVIILDASTSVTQANYDKMLAFTKDLLKDADIDSGAVRVGILIYSTEVQIIFHLNRYRTKADVYKYIDNIPYIYGSTNTADALKTMHETMFTRANGDRPDVANTGIVITDGVSNINAQRTIPEAEAARAAKITVYAIGIGLADTTELDGIANKPTSDYSYNVQSFTELEALHEKICPGVPAPVTTVKPVISTCGLATVDVVIIIDASTSVTEANFKKMLDFCKDIVQTADIDSGDVRVGVLIYSTEVEIQFHLNQYSTNADVAKAIDAIPYIYGSTNTADALKTMHEQMFVAAKGDRPDVDNVAIVLTDGVSNINARRTIPEAENARNKGIEVYVIGIALQDIREVEAMASVPKNKHLYNVQRFEELKGLEEDIFGGEEGAECGKKPVVKPKCGLSKVDVVIILDASTSVTEPNYKKMLQFCKNIVDRADIDSGSVRIGVLIYSTEVQIQFHLNQYRTSAEVKEAIDRIPYIYGSTNSADALQTMHTTMFSAANGDRPDVENIAFMITDGVSNINGRRTIPEAENARNKGIRVYAIGIGLDDTRELEGMGSEPKSENVFNVKQFDELNDVIDRIFGGNATACAPDLPPVANAGSDIETRYPVPLITLDGRASTDDKAVVKYMWTLQDGERIQTWSTLTVTLFNQPVGVYYFTLYVEDEKGQTDDDTVKVTVLAQDFPPKANAGDDVTIQLPRNYVELDSSMSSDDVRIVDYYWALTSGNLGSVIMEGNRKANMNVRNLAEGVYTFTLTVADELGQSDGDSVDIVVKAQDFPPKADAGQDVTIQHPDNVVTLDGSRSSDDVKIVSYSWTLLDGDSNGLGLEGENSERLTVKNLHPGNYTFTLAVYDQLGQVSDDTVVVNVKAQDYPPRANAGDDVYVKLPVDTATVDGSLSTDDIKIVRYVWVLADGDSDGLVLAGDDTSQLNVRNLKEGNYTFALTVYDQLGQVDADTVMVMVSARDKPPVANAGTDISIQLPVNTVTLNGSASTDDVGIVQYLWSGDRRARISDLYSVRPLVEGLDEGVYRFNLTVFDMLRQADEDYVDVTVRAADKPPKAVAGDDVVITLPQNYLTLDGRRSSDDVGIVRYRWRMRDGNENAVTMDGDRTALLQLTNMQPGAYTFGLTVVDAKEQKDVDYVTVVVQPAPTTPAPAACGLAATDLVFVVDASTSVTEANFQKQKFFMKSMVEYADIDSGSVRVGALIYSTEVEVQFYLNQYTTKQAVLDAVDKIPYIYGSTNTADGLKVMRDELFSFRNGDRDDASNVAMVITDGVSNINSRRTIPEAEQSRHVGIHIYAIGIGLTDTRELEAIASAPSTANTFAVSDFSELQGLEKRIFQSICKETPAPTTTILITTPVPVTTPKPCGLAKTDLIFILDASTSVTETNFQKMRDFLKEFLANSDIDSGSVRVGINIYSTEVEVQFHLNKYTRSRNVMAAVDRIPYIYGSTNTADALQSMSANMFTPGNGDRPDAPNVCILLTDGVSNINSRRTIPEAEAARAKGIHIYVIGIALQDTLEVDAIATPPASDNSFHVDTFDQLKGLHKTIFSTACPEMKDDPPTADAGPDRTIQLPEEYVIISGDGSRDDVGVVKYEWSQISGPDVQVDKTNDPRLTLRGLKPGTYVLELTVHDKLDQTNTDTVTLNLLPPDAPPVADAGPDQTIQLPDNNVLLNGSRSTDDVRIITYRWKLTSGDDRGVRMTGDRTPRLNVDGLKEGEYVFQLTVEDGKEQLSSDDVRVVVQPADAPPVANAGPDQTVQLPDNRAVLDGSRSTDDVRIVTYRWKMTSGDDRGVRMTGDRTPRLNVDDIKEGEYVFQLTVSDGKEQLSTDEARVVVRAVPDAPPVANAGPDQTIQLPEDRVILDGSRSTDDVRIVTYRWKLTSGDDRGVRMTGDRTPRLNVDGMKEGEYVFQLTVSDGKEQLSTDEVRVVVRAAPDAPPVANAGPDHTIRLPNDSVILDGSRSTDDKRIVTYRWKMTSGDSRGVRMTGDRTQRLNVDGLKEGEYVFQLEVSDEKEQLSYDEARVVVQKAPRVSGYDVIFVLDSSVNPDHFRWMINYTRAAVREMSIDDVEFRVGHLIYSTTAMKQFDLKDYDTKAGVLGGIDRVPYRPGGKNTAAALKYVRKQMFTPENGDRDFAKNYIILLTGNGTSDDPFDAATEACTIQAQGVGMFGIGFGDIPNRDELDAYSSVPTSDYEITMRNEASMGEIPGLMVYNLKNRTPRPAACPVKPTRVYNVTDCFATADVVFVLDSSGSVGQDNFYRLRNFTYQTIDGLDIDSGRFRVGVTTFSDTSRLDFNLNEFSNKRDMEDALRKRVVYMYGNTHTAHALRRARLEMFTPPAGDRPEVPNVVVIITDGQSNVNHELTIPEARALKAAGVTILTVAVGFTSETSELIGITSPPIQENLIYTEDYESLGKLKEQLISPLCTDSNLCRNNPCVRGACLDGIRTYVCQCPEGYFGDNCDKQCGESSDVVIVLDSSNTVGEYNFGRLKEYAEHLVREMNKDACDINIGFMKYSSNAMVQVHLGAYDDTETNIRALEQISYSRGRANMAAAFRAIRTEMFNGRRGDRTNAKNIAYFLTDGTNDVHKEMAEPEAEVTISSGIRVIPIGINLRERYELDNLAEKQGISVIEINDEPMLIENTEKILRPLYEGNNYCAENPCSNGGLCKNEPFGYTCECQVGYTGDTCTQRCSAKGDVVFVVDTSRYVTRKELKSIRKFLRSIVKRLKFHRDQFSVGMVQFTNTADVTLTFEEGHSKKAVRSAIAGLRVHGGDPDPAQALAKAAFRIFKGRGESRDKPDYMILVTKSMRQEEEILTEANKLKIEGTRILGVGIGLTSDEQEYMQSVVSMPFNETAMFADDRTDLDQLADNIVQYMCDDENLCAENPCRNGGQCHRVGGDFYCECGIGYAGRYCENKCNARADIVFLLDSSGSVGHQDFRKVKQFVTNMVSDLQVGRDASRIGLATYSSKSRHGFFLNKYPNLFQLQNAIAGINYEYGNTNTAEGLRMIREHYFNGRNGDRKEIQDFLIVLTDGVSNVNPDQTLVEAQLIKAKGVHIYAVGVGDFDATEINGIASSPASKNAYLLIDYGALSNISSDIVRATCRDPTVCDENPCRNGGVCVPGINGLFCECRVGYRGEFCQESCVSVKDIFFLLDSSDSVGSQNFETAKRFVTNIIEEFSSKDSYNRFSLITFSTEVQIVFSLGRYNNLQIIQNAVKYARYRPGNTNTAGALRVVEEIAHEDLGDRQDAENIVFVITDGVGNVNEDDTINAAEALKNKGARIISIGVNLNERTEIERMASSETDVFMVRDYDDLEDIAEDIIKTTCKNGNVIALGK